MKEKHDNITGFVSLGISGW